MKIAMIQNSPVFGEVIRNIDDLFSSVDSVSADLYIMPELAYTGYQFRDKAELLQYADSPESRRINAFVEKARERNAALVFGFAERAGNNRVYNSAMMVRPDGKTDIYRKTHLFYREKELFTPGDTGFFVVPFRGARIGLAICFDWIFPESFRTLALKGAQIIVHSANLVMPYCQKADYARAVENRVFVCTANRTGHENRAGEKLTFTGGSVCFAPDGTRLMNLPDDAPAVECVDIDPSRADREKNLNPFNNVINDRRPDMYAHAASMEKLP